MHHHLERVSRHFVRGSFGYLLEVSCQRHGYYSCKVVLLLRFVDKVGVFRLCDVGAIDDNDLAAFLNLDAKVRKVLLRVEVLRGEIVEFKDNAIVSGQLSRYSGFSGAWQASNDVAELETGSAEPRV